MIMNDGVVFSIDEWKQSNSWLFLPINKFHDLEMIKHLMSKMNISGFLISPNVICNDESIRKKIHTIGDISNFITIYKQSEILVYKLLFYPNHVEIVAPNTTKLSNEIPNWLMCVGAIQ